VRRKDAATVGLSYEPSFSELMETWDPGTAPLVVVAEDASYEVVAIPFPAGTSFFRVRVTVAP
jgi:hypothetical protein